ncbi:MAG TPA: hypothetical protein VFE14_18760, partial [Micromonosporaceae bacterium]|nr:hypothetical protein [Micromonosporaceae bacterium]
MTIKRLAALLAAMSAVLLVGASVPPAAAAEQPPPADAWVTVEAPPLPWEDPATAPRRTDRVLQSTIDAAVEAAKHPVRTGSLHQLPPPTPPLAGALAGCTGGACFTYGRIGQDYGTDKGSGADMTITTAKPFVLSYGHSLGENSIQSDGSSTADVVEVGWIVDLAQRADGNPFLFGFFWVHGVPDTYNSAAWVDFTANPINLGAGLPKPVNKR